jgi:hypothetical protein
VGFVDYSADESSDLRNSIGMAALAGLDSGYTYELV